MDPGFMQGLHKSMVFISMLFAEHLHRYCAFCTCSILMPVRMYAMVGHHWWGHYCVPFGLSSHSRSLTAPNSTNKCSNTPLEIMLYICVWNIHKNPFYCETSPDGLWRKSKFVRWGNPSYSLEKIQICELGKSFWLGGCPGCWIIAGGWFQSQHCRPNFHYQFVTNNTIHSCCMLIIYFSVTPISLRYTSIIQNQRTPLVHSLHYIW